MKKLRPPGLAAPRAESPAGPRGQQGQLVDGQYGAENYRALGENGIVRGKLRDLF